MMRPVRTKSSRGLTVVAVIVCLIVVTTISLAMLKFGLAEREQARALERRHQAEWLAASGMSRALSRLAADREYAGEVWSIPAEELWPAEDAAPAGPTATTRPPAAIVTIRVERPQGAAERRLVRVSADFPSDSPRRSRQSKQRLITLKPNKPGAAT
jgi:Tfp pilus assembly protein PilV